VRFSHGICDRNNETNSFEGKDGSAIPSTSEQNLIASYQRAGCSPYQQREILFIKPPNRRYSPFHDDNNFIPTNVYDPDEDKYVRYKGSKAQFREVANHSEWKKHDELGENEQLDRNQSGTFRNGHDKGLQDI
jgi:hypothetical protein